MKYFTKIIIFLLILLYLTFSFLVADIDPEDKEQDYNTNEGWLGVRIIDLAHLLRNPVLREEFKDTVSIYEENENNISGIFITEVIPESPADEYGILPGYIIKKVQRITIDNSFTFSFIISKIEPEETIELEIWDIRGNYNLYIRLGERPYEMRRSPNSGFYRNLESERKRLLRD